MQQIIRKPIYPTFNYDCNNTNLHEYSPYIIKDNIHIIDINWWDNLSEHTQKIISNKTNFVLDKVDIPHDFQFDDESKFITKVYKSYIDSFDYHIWYPLINHLENVPKDVIIINIPQDLKDIFIKIYNHEMVDNDILSIFKSDLLKKMIPNKKYFVRLSGTSGKNIKSVRPFTNINDIILHITSNKLFIVQEYMRCKDSCLILIPWNEDIQEKYEYRIFVVNGQLTGASQQHIRQLYNYTSDELEMIETSLNNISFLDKMPYKNYVADIYCIDNVFKLIELNPFGAHSGAGSSLFNWITDNDILNGIKQSELRYLSIINY